MAARCLIRGVGDALIIEWAVQMTTTRGSLFKCDLLNWEMSSYGMALGFVKVVVAGEERFAAIVQSCAYDVAALSMSLVSDRYILFSDCLPEPVPFVRDGDSI